MRALIMGCGSVGRGLLAPILLKAGYAVTFIESNVELANEISTRRYWPVLLNQPRKLFESHLDWFGPVKSFIPLASMPEPDIIFVAVRIQNLNAVGRALYDWLIDHKPSKPLPIIVCENTPDAASKLENAVETYFPNVFYRSAIAECVIPEVPQEMQEIDPLLTYADPNGYLLIDGRNLPEKSAMEGVVYSNNFAFDWDLKWYCHCALHAVIALLGLKAGHQYIHETMRDSAINCKIGELSNDIVLNLIAKYPNKGLAIRDRSDLELERLRGADRPDLCTRVVRDIERKLTKGERLMDMLELVGGKHPIIEEAIEYARTLTMAYQVC